MWIERIDIELFQAMKQQSIGPLQPGMVVFLGMNGAGKTTVMEFIRWVLYGDVTSAANRLGTGEENHKKHGSISLRDQNAKCYCVTRMQTPSGSKKISTSLTLNDRPCTQADVDDLLARIDRDTFRTVFAIGLEELRQSDDIKKVQDSLASALQGTGATSLPAAVGKFEAEAKKYAHSNGNTNTEASKQADIIKESDRRIRELQNDQDRYDALQSELSELQADNLRIKVELQQQNTSLSKTQVLEGAWAEWCELHSLQAQLEQQKDALDLPLSRREEYKQLKAQLEGLTAQLEERRSEIAEKQRQLQQVVEKINQPLLDQEQAVRDICQRIKQHDEQLRGIARLTRECESMRQQIEDELVKLGVGWNAERLKQAHIDLQLQTRLNSANADLASAKQNHDQLRADQRSAAQAIESKQLEIDSRRRKLGDYEALPTSEQISSGKVKLSELTEKLQHRQTVQTQISAISQTAAAPTSPWWLLVMLGVLLVIIGGWQLAAGQQAVGIVLILVGIGLITLALGIRPKTQPSTASGSPLEEQLNTLQSGIAQICQQLGITEAERLSLQQTLEDQSIQLNGRLALQREIELLEADLARLNGQPNSHALLDAVQRLQQAQAQWDQLMQEIGLPEGLSLETANHTLERIQHTQSTRLKLEQSTKELEKARAVHQQLNDELLPLQALIDTDPTAAIWDRVVDLDARLATSLTNDAQRVMHESEIQRQLSSVPLITQKIEEARQAMADILQVFGAEDELQMEQLYERAVQAREIEAQINKLDALLDGKSGPGDARKRLNEQLTQVTERLELTQSIQQLQQQIAESSALVDKQNTECGQLQEQIKRLETDTALTEQLAIREQAKLELQEVMLKWLRPWQAHKLLSDIQASYVNDHQGPVLALASELLEQITNGRIKQLKTEPEGKDKIEFLAIPSDGSEPLKPSHWNQALREQAYFAIRLGFMLDHFEKRSPVPVVLDDILANCDPHHQQRLAEVITGIAQRKGHQLLFFTCHPETAELFQGCQRGDISALQVVLG